MEGLLRKAQPFVVAAHAQKHGSDRRAAHLPCRPLVPDCGFAKAKLQKRIVAGIGLQSGDTRQLFIINGVTNRLHDLALS